MSFTNFQTGQKNGGRSRPIIPVTILLLLLAGPCTDHNTRAADDTNSGSTDKNPTRSVQVYTTGKIPDELPEQAIQWWKKKIVKSKRLKETIQVIRLDAADIPWGLLIRSPYTLGSFATYSSTDEHIRERSLEEIAGINCLYIGSEISALIKRRKLVLSFSCQTFEGDIEIPSENTKWTGEWNGQSFRQLSRETITL